MSAYIFHSIGPEKSPDVLLTIIAKSTDVTVQGVPVVKSSKEVDIG
ncbi:MAG: hypothetical protein HOE85_00675 [Nitrospinaceae bacterium]|nr:hypothetical protein [Nitrospinaceae bacterium]